MKGKSARCIGGPKDGARVSIVGDCVGYSYFQTAHVRHDYRLIGDADPVWQYVGAVSFPVDTEG